MDKELERLKAMCSAIEDLLKEEDMVGVIIVQGPSKAEYCINLEASWTPIKHEHEGLLIQCKAKTGGEVEKEKLKQACGVISTFITLGDGIREQFVNVLKAFGERGISFTHTTSRIDHE